MKRDAIERLAIDSATGEMNEDAEALFRTYLSEHPEADSWALEMQETYRKTEETISAKTSDAAKADTRTAVVDTRPRPPIDWQPVARWAAVVLLAAFVGAVMGRWSKTPAPLQKPVQVTALPGLTAERPGLNLDDIGESFWGRKAIAMFAAKPTMIGEAYITGPTLWEKYRQFLKERHYE